MSAPNTFAALQHLAKVRDLVIDVTDTFPNVIIRWGCPHCLARSKFGPYIGRVEAPTRAEAIEKARAAIKHDFPVKPGAKPGNRNASRERRMARRARIEAEKQAAMEAA